MRLLAAVFLLLAVGGCGVEGVSLQPPLAGWQAALAGCRTRVVNVVVVGDSRTIADATVAPGVAGTIVDTFGQKWADRLAATLGAACGRHGTGLVPLLPIAGRQAVNADYYTAEGSWGTGTVSVGPYQTGALPAGLVMVTQGAVTIRFAPGLVFDRLLGYCVAGPRWHGWTLWVDGAQVGTCGGAALAEAAVVGAGAASLGQHAAAMVCAVAPCGAYGMEATAGSTGVSVHNLAVGSCTAECFGLEPARQMAFGDLIGAPDLVIVAMLTNEPGVGYSTGSFGAALKKVIAHERGLGGSSVLLYAPLQNEVAGLGPYYAVLPGVAEANDAAYIDLRTSYGSGFLAQYFGPDGVHENNAGQGWCMRPWRDCWDLSAPIWVRECRSWRSRSVRGGSRC